MSELQSYAEEFQRAYWADEDPAQCGCRGNGWALSDVDTWHECPIHHCGQLHPEDSAFDTDEGFEKADKLSRAQWRVKAAKKAVEAANHAVWCAKNEVAQAEKALAAMLSPAKPVAVPPPPPVSDDDCSFSGEIPF